MKDIDKNRVIMVVTNPASNDVRVVKQAEELIRHGMQCTVLGILKPGFEPFERINGVEYIRVPVRYSWRAVLLGYFPGLTNRFFKMAPAPAVASSNSGEAKLKIRIPGREKRYTLGDIATYVLRRLYLISGLYIARSIFFKGIFKIAFLQPVAVRVRQGAYLQAFYPTIRFSDAHVIESHELGPLESCVLAASGRKVIYDSHELERHRNSQLKKIARQVYVSYEEKYIRSADVVFAVSPGCANQIKSDYHLPEVFLVRNSPLLSMQQTSNPRLREKLGLDDDAKLMVYTGSLTFNRGLENVLGVLPFLEGVHFACVGPANESVKADLVTLGSRLGVSKRLHLVDRVEPGVLISFISDADLAVIPIQNACLSYYYCLPNKVFEAMHAGLTVVASDLPDLRQLIDATGIGFVCNTESPDELSEALIKALAKTRDYNPSKLREEYCFEKEFAQVLPFYIG